MDEDVFLAPILLGTLHSRIGAPSQTPKDTYIGASSPLAAVTTSSYNMVAEECQFPLSSGRITVLSSGTSSSGKLAGSISSVDCSDSTIATMPTTKHPSCRAPSTWRDLEQSSNPAKNPSTLSNPSHARVEKPMTTEQLITHDLPGTSRIGRSAPRD